MTSKRLEGVKAVIFDLGDTLYTLPYSIEEYHMKFLKAVLGEDFIVTTEELDTAHEAAEIALEKLIDDNATGPNYSLSDAEWHHFDKILLENLGVGENLDEYASEYQKLWNALLKSAPNELREGAKEVLRNLPLRDTRWVSLPIGLKILTIYYHHQEFGIFFKACNGQWSKAIVNPRHICSL